MMRVLILVVMEDSLGLLEDAEQEEETLRLNPCCNGR